MENGIYQALVLIVAFLGIIYGFRRGITGQLASLLGFGFGAVCARVFTPVYSESFVPWAEKIFDPHYVEIAASLLCGVCIYFVVYFIFSIASGVLRGALSVFQVGMFNRLVGAFFSLTCSLLWLSIALNLLMSMNPDSALMKYEKSDDGNMVAAVMGMTSSILGCCGAEELAHAVQLEKASAISRNFKGIENVIIEKA